MTSRRNHELHLTDRLRDLLESIWCDHPIPPYDTISCQTGDGFNVFEKKLQTHVSNTIYGDAGTRVNEDILITRQRHRQHLLSCVQHLDLFLNCNLTMDLAAEELR
jgi:tRNA U34 5-carboxymethylaminomethyl modifying GTPase MnmE/TrmE